MEETLKAIVDSYAGSLERAVRAYHEALKNANGVDAWCRYEREVMEGVLSDFGQVVWDELASEGIAPKHEWWANYRKGKE